MLDEKLGVYIEMFAAAIRLDVIGLANFSEVTRPHSVFLHFQSFWKKVIFLQKSFFEKARPRRQGQAS